jgi:branched-chain amino acid transport system ATP-binding protein
MVAIGRVLLGAPRVVLLDEPGLGLSPRLVGDMYKYLEEIRQMGATTILVEQSIERAAAFASQMIVLSAGRVVEVLPSLSGESVARVERLLMGPGLDE